MELREFYQDLGEDFDALLRRLGGSEIFLRKYLGKFLEDPNYELLREAVVCKDYDTALKAAHTIKGVGQNLNLGVLYKPCEAIVSCVRGGEYAKLAPLFREAESAYQRIAHGLREIL